MPVVQTTKVELIINLKTAKSLGLTVPTALPKRELEKKEETRLELSFIAGDPRLIARHPETGETVILCRSADRRSKDSAPPNSAHS